MHKLELVKASPASFVVAGDNDLFLLYGEWQKLPTWVLLFEYSGVEAICTVQVSIEEGAAPLFFVRTIILS